MRRVVSNAPNAEVITYLLRCSMETAGPMVAIALEVNTPRGDGLAVEFAKQGLRVARALGLYGDDKEKR